MRFSYSLCFILPLLILLGCQDENPYIDSTNWNMNQTVDQLSRIIQKENQLLDDLTDKNKRELWALLMDECDIGFEIWVRLKRNRRLKKPFCESMSLELVPHLDKRTMALRQLKQPQTSLLLSIAPSPEALAEFQQRYEAFSVEALRDRCGSPSGYKQRAWP